MKVRQLLPSKLRVATETIAQDASNVVRAFRSRRTKSHRVHTRVEVEIDGVELEVTVAYSAPVMVPRLDTELAVIEFSDSGVRVVVTDPGQTLLEAGLEAGVDLLFSCAAGGCGACMLHVEEGHVDYEDRDSVCLTDDEINEGSCLACVGRPRGHVVVSG